MPARRNNTVSAGRWLVSLPALILAHALAAGEGFREPPPLAEIVGTADAIVLGSVRSVAEGAFELSVETVVHPDESLETGSVHVAHPGWTSLEPRWAPYERGQRVLVFLDRDEPATTWRHAARPADSEWPVTGGTVYLHNRFIEGLKIHRAEIDGHGFPAQRMPVETVVEAMRGYRECFAWMVDNGAWSVSPTCTEEHIDAYTARSSLHRQLVRETRQHLRAADP